jgi:hypothetical protein
VAVGDYWPRASFEVTERFERSPDLIGLFTVLLTENLDPDAPLHERFLGRYQDAVTIVTEGILAAHAFKAQALVAADVRGAPTADTEVFRRGKLRRPRIVGVSLQNV